MSGSRIRALIVDDSAFARKVVRELLERHPDIEVVGTARDGLDALEKLGELSPDVLTLDLVMPHLDGLGLLRALKERPWAPKVVVISMAESDSELVLSALEEGAFDFIQKPTALATERLYEMADELAQKVRLAAGAGAQQRSTDAPISTSTGRPAGGLVPAPASAGLGASGVSSHASGFDLAVVGTSTGGPQALTRLLADLPGGFPLPLAIALHIPRGYTETLAKRLNGTSPLEVLEASDGMRLKPGRAVLARAGWHLKIERDENGFVARLDVEPFGYPHIPSVDVLFQSAAQAAGGRALGVVLTGMGNDGLEGARAIHAAGGRLLVEAASSCVVYGMPRSVAEAGLASEEVELRSMAERMAVWNETVGRTRGERD